MRIGKNIAITHHAIDRMEQRMGIKMKDIMITVKNAFYSHEVICSEFNQSKYNLKNATFSTYHYRKHKGFIFCFQKKYVDFVLLTVFKEDKYYFLKNEINTQEAIRRNACECFLPEMYQGKNGRMRRKNNPRARHNLRRQTSK